MEKVAVIVPVRNESENLARILYRIPRSIRGHETLLVVSDDHSEDESAEIALQFTPHVVRSEKRTGVGGNTKRALEYLRRFDDVGYVIKMDGDGQHDPSHLSDVLYALKFQGRDIVACSRFHPESPASSAPPLDRLILNRTMSRLIGEVTGWEVTDARTGFMGFHYADVMAITHQLFIEGYGVPLELMLRIWRSKPDAEHAEIPHPALYHGVSKRLDEKYWSETDEDKSDRLKVAYQAMLLVLSDLGVDTEDLLQVRRRKKGNGELYHNVFHALP